MISHDLWMRRFNGDPGVLGKVVQMHSVDRAEAPSLVTIVGVLPKNAWPIQWRESSVLRPMPVEKGWSPQLARLAPNTSRRESEEHLTAIVRAQITEPIDSSWRMTLVPALDSHSQRVRPLLIAVLGAAAFMFLAACGSVAGALISRTASRHGELAIRLALGGSRARVVRQLLTESGVLFGLAGAIGLAIAYALLAGGGTIVERQLGITTPGGAAALRPTLPLMAQCILASVVTGVALGALPAITFLQFHRTNAATVLLATARSALARSGATVVRRILIGAQVSVATVLLFGAGLMFRTLARLNDTPLGFNANGVVRASMMLPKERYPDSTAKRQLMTRLLESMSRVPGVRGVATVAPSPFSGSWRFPVEVDGSRMTETAAPNAAVFTVSPEFFDAMQIPRLAGRGFRPTDDAQSPLVVVVSQRLASRIAPNGDAVGRRIRVRVPYRSLFDEVDARPWRTVVGIVGDMRTDFEPENPPDVYVPYSQNPRSFQAIVLRVDRGENTVVEAARRAVTRIDPSLALFDVAPLNDVIASHGAQRRGLSVLLGGFAAFALGLSALALYASLSYTVVQRRSELALRRAVGASSGSILGLVVTEGLITTAVGIAVGASASVALGRVIENQLYGVGSSDPATLVTIALVLSFAAVVACLVPGMRATRTDPVLALRE